MRLSSIVGAVCVLALACCGNSDDGDRDGELIGLSFSSDYLEQYGPIQVTLDSGETIVLDDLDAYTCDNTPLRVENDEFRVEAMSQRFFYWSDGRREWRGDCIVVHFDLASLDTGIHFFFRSDNGVNPCFPVEYRVGLGNVEVSLGTIEKSWKGEYSRDGLVEAARDVMEKVREGRAVAVGGWRSPVLYEVRTVEPPHCPPQDFYTMESPPQGILGGHGTHFEGW